MSWKFKFGMPYECFGPNGRQVHSEALPWFLYHRDDV
jgi:hypothetical protein